MSRQHLVRIGVLGHVGRFTSVDGRAYPRGSRVVCRTVRGLELGEVLSTAGVMAEQADGVLLRAMTVEDDLLQSRLEKNRRQAFDACTALLRERGAAAVLMEVEQLFDGSSLYFYFLGDVPPEAEALVGELTETYEAEARLRSFADTLSAGCGPGCGTEEAAGCGTAGSGCASCAVSGACGTR